MRALEWLHLFVLGVGIIATVVHMNKMYTHTPLWESVAWWCVGMGLFGEFCWQAWWLWHDVPYYLGAEHVFLGVGVTALIILITQPDWRPTFADRRRRVQEDLPPECDRRCQTLMNTRRTRRL